MDIIFAHSLLNCSVGISPSESKQVKECLQMFRCYGFQSAVRRCVMNNLEIAVVPAYSIGEE